LAGTCSGYMFLGFKAPPPAHDGGFEGRKAARKTNAHSDFQPEFLNREGRQMGSDSRFYQLELRHRPALHGDVGSLLRIEGLVVGGEGARAIFMLPQLGNPRFAFVPQTTPMHELTAEEWTDWLQRSDNPEVLVQGSMEKVFHRKVRYEISGHVQQKVWVADGFKCMFCGVSMGRAQLTVDHFVPLEMGGVNDTSNYLTACRSCNKRKGGMDPKDFCAERKLDYDFFVGYLKTRKLP